jgi:hypothetical protein
LARDCGELINIKVDTKNNVGKQCTNFTGFI